MSARRESERDLGEMPSEPFHAVAGVVIAVKGLTAAKSRLASEFSAPDRTRLVLAMLRDTVAAADAVAAVDTVMVVTPDPVVAATARRIGARVFDEPIGDAAGGPNGSLNHAFSSAAAELRRELTVRLRDNNDTCRVDSVDIVALQADLPALRPTELAQAYAAAQRGGRSIVVDHHGTGTAALILKNSSGELAPLFGSDSARRHTESGARRLDGAWPGLRLDVDTVDDVRRAHRLGVGPATAAVLSSLGWSTDAHVTSA